MSKFMQSLDLDVYARLELIAKERSISIQELMRAIVIPEWLLSLEAKAIVRKNFDFPGSSRPPSLLRSYDG